MTEKNNTVIPVCLACDRNYLQPMAVTMASVLKNKAPSDLIRFYILENTFTDSDRHLLGQLKSIADFEIIHKNVKDKALSLFPLKKNDKVTIEAYFRLLIPDLIPEEDRIIYLDCDIIVQSSLSRLYEMDMGENYILGVRDIDSRRHTKRLNTHRYINSGVLLMNSKAMRENGILDQFVDYVAHNRERIEMHDQDVIVAVLQEHLRYISDTWNGQIERLPFREEFSRLHQANILHYVGHRKPWLPNKRARMRENYFRYLRLTPFANTETKYKTHRFFWHLSKLPSNILKLLYSKTNSRHGTYREIRILGLFRFRKKRKSPLHHLDEKW